MTTSWDDADPLDIRLAESLAEHGMKGTFYLCREFEGKSQMSATQIRELACLPGVEVGAHTLTHPDLRRLGNSQLNGEVHGSKAWLEDIIQSEISCFAYPKGLHNARVVGVVREAGFSIGRTTKGGCTAFDFPAERMPTTFQIFPHSRWTQARHAVKEGDASGLRGILRVRPWSREPSELAAAFLASVEVADPLLHVWGHSWEIEEYDLWTRLERLFELFRDVQATPMTNGDVYEVHGRAREK